MAFIFKNEDHDFRNDLEAEEFITRLANLSEIFEGVNHLNMSFQEQNCTVLDFVSKLGESWTYGRKMWKPSTMECLNFWQLLTWISVMIFPRKSFIISLLNCCITFQMRQILPASPILSHLIQPAYLLGLGSKRS